MIISLVFFLESSVQVVWQTELICSVCCSDTLPSFCLAPMRFLNIAGVLLLAFLSIHCTPSSGELPVPPDGWVGIEGKWWMEGVDTVRAFRDLESLRSMGLYEEEVLAANASVARRSGIAKERLIIAVKQSLIPLFRNDPEHIDSLFTLYVAPKLDQADLSQNLGDLASTFKKDGYKSLRNHYREPRKALEVGTDIPLAYPDSLKNNNIGGRVSMQVRLNREGMPEAIQLLESVHPVLDALAMEATSKLEWSPAYVMENGRWKPESAWIRFSISYRSG